VLMRGWTTVRDIGGPSQGLAQAIDEGVVPGPRIYTSAMTISQTSGHADGRTYNEPHPAIFGTTDWWAGRFSLLADGPGYLLGIESELISLSKAIAEYAFDPAQMPAMQAQFVRPGGDQ